jgi:hypothetical protein
MAACIGPCNRRYREARDAFEQALAEYDPLNSEQSRPEPPGMQPWEGDPVWCGKCAASISLKLAEMDDLAAILAATADGFRDAPAGMEHVSGSGEPGSPSRAADDLDELSAMLSGWEVTYRDLMQWPSPPPRGELASAETACIAWLRRHLNGILASPAGEDFGREILQWHREINASAKTGVRTLLKPMRCPSCQLLTLTWTEGETSVSCGNPDCNRILSLAEYDAEVERLAKEPQQVA